MRRMSAQAAMGSRHVEEDLDDLDGAFVSLNSAG